MSIFVPTNTSSLNFSTLVTPFANSVSATETNLNNLINTYGNDPSTTDLLNLQTVVTQYSLMISTESTLIKDLGDSLKGIVQRFS